MEAMDDSREAAPVDLSGLDDATEGDVELMRELVTEFLEDTGDRLDAMRRGIEEDNPVLLRNEAHALKGSSGVVGAAGMAGIALALERCAEGRDVEACSEAVERLEVEFDRVRMFFRERF
jgi:HPt (histidine-containing phosphotransfer) domain-containing protein